MAYVDYMDLAVCLYNLLMILSHIEYRYYDLFTNETVIP